MTILYTSQLKFCSQTTWFAGILFVLLTASADLFAGGDANVSKITDLEKQANQQLLAIQTGIGDAACDSDSDCRTLAIGHRACGGPSAYLAYSVKNTNEQIILEEARAHTATVREINHLKGLISTCEMLMPPPVACINHQCNIQQ